MTRSRQQTLGRFVVVGSLTVLIDALVYASLRAGGMDPDVAKGVSFAVGAVFAYVTNWRFTFGARRSRWSEGAFVAVYLAALVLNVGTHAVLAGPLGLGATLAFLGATAVSAAWNFVGMSTFVFSSDVPERRLVRDV